MVQWEAGYTPRHTHKESLENGDIAKEDSRHALPEKADSSDEYTNLLRYVVTYRDGRRRSTASGVTGDGADDDGSDGQPKKRPWWAFWRKKTSSGAGSDFVLPDEWVTTNIRQGLSSFDIESRRRKVGWNELTTEKENMFLKFLSYFTGPILYGKFLRVVLPAIIDVLLTRHLVMEIAVVLAAGLRDWIDFGVIIAILLLNATVGWYQEKQAADVVASLRGDIAMKAVVVRDGQEFEIKAREIVPGDIVCVDLTQNSACMHKLTDFL